MGHHEESMLREALSKAKQIIENLTGPPYMLAPVMHVRATKGKPTEVAELVVLFNGSPAVMRPMEGYTLKIGDVGPGSWVGVQGSHIVSIEKDLPTTGRIAVVSAVISDTEFEAQEDGHSARRFAKSSDLKLDKGDRVVLVGDHSVSNLGKTQTTFVTETAQVAWAEIGGHGEAKLALREAIEFPHTHKELYAAYGKRATKGVLLHGPSGTGKTLLAKAAATALAETHGAKHSTGFIYVKGPEVLSKWVGDSEATIRSLFSRARSHKKEHGYPAVIFVDEADALLGARGSEHHRNTLASTIVPTFLAEMDGFEESAAVVLLATNRPDVLDPAVVRDGRVDRKIYVGRPTQDAAREIFAIHLKGLSIARGVSVEELCETGTNMLYDQSKVLYRVKRQGRVQTTDFTLGHVASGAMIQGVCQQAVGTALHRDIEAKAKAPSGISKEDFGIAVSQLFRAHQSLNHDDDLQQFVRPFKDEVVEIMRAASA